MGFMLSPFSALYSGLTSFRNHLYESSILKTHKANIPVVSVGNLTMGGTGKTPFIDKLIKEAVLKGLKPGVVSRGYGGDYSGVAKVDLNKEAASSYFGDEPVMLANKNKETPIYLSAKRIEAVQSLIEKETVNIVFADDAFQHRSLHRDLDIVLLDALEPLENYKVIPQGRGRESVESLRRADFIIITKSNLVSPEKLSEVQVLASRYVSDKNSILLGEYQVNEVKSYQDNEGVFGFADEVLLVSGVGRPESVELATENLKLKVSQHKVYKDHHKFSTKDVEDILQEAQGKKILTTEKDFIKINELLDKEAKEKFFYLSLEYNLKGKIDSFYERIFSLAI